MKNLTCFLLAISLAVAAPAQKVYFIYFETDNGAPFYLKMQEKLFSSTGSGYFIVPNLIDSVYTISIGFPSVKSEYKFRIPMDGKDHGFQIKQFDFGWGLFDLQALTILRPLADTWKSSVSYEYRTNDFTALLAKASNDTTLFYIPVPIKEDVAVVQQEKPVTDTFAAPAQNAEVITAVLNDSQSVQQSGALFTNTDSLSGQSVAQVNAPDSTMAVKETAVTDSLQQAAHDPLDVAVVDSVAVDQPGGNTQPVKDAVDSNSNIGVDSTVTTNTDIQPSNSDTVATISVSSYSRSQVKRYAESSTSEGFGLVFHDTENEITDTIRLIIPNPLIVFSQPDTTAVDNGMLEIKKDSVAATETVEAPVNKIDTIVVAVKDRKKELPEGCRVAASHNDFLKLRKNMAARDSDEDMMQDARKAFRSKCFSTEQIRNLSVLFLTSGGKYHFFDVAWGHVTDPHLFPELESEIREDYFLKRFKALIGE